MSDETRELRAMYEESRQRDIQAMLLALVLIEQAKYASAMQVLIARLPEDIAAPLKAKVGHS